MTPCRVFMRCSGTLRGSGYRGPKRAAIGWMDVRIAVVTDYLVSPFLGFFDVINSQDRIVIPADRGPEARAIADDPSRLGIDVLEEELPSEPNYVRRRIYSFEMPGIIRALFALPLLVSQEDGGQRTGVRPRGRGSRGRGSGQVSGFFGGRGSDHGGRGSEDGGQTRFPVFRRTGVRRTGVTEDGGGRGSDQVSGFPEDGGHGGRGSDQVSGFRRTGVRPRRTGVRPGFRFFQRTAVRPQRTGVRVRRGRGSEDAEDGGQRTGVRPQRTGVRPTEDGGQTRFPVFLLAIQ